MDQGQRSTCLACAATAGHEVLQQDTRLSIEHLYQGAAARAGVSATGVGVTMDALATAIVAEGQCESSIWPYHPIRPLPRPTDLGKTHHLTAGAVLPFDLSTLRSELATGHQVVVGLHLTRSFFLADPQPICVQYPPEARSGAHAVLAVALDEPATTMTVRNSWGTGWGAGGYADISYEYLARYGLALLSLVL